MGGQVCGSWRGEVGGFGPGLIGLRGRGSEDSDFQAYEKGLGLGILGLKEDVAGRLDALV